MNAEQMLFLRGVVPAAQDSQRETGVPASVTIAQAILESGWGKSSLAVKACNYFGVKATKLDPYIELPTTEFVNGVRVPVSAAFRAYESAAESFTAHGSMLSRSLRYAPCMAVKDDPLKFCDELEACGYSTNPQYAETLRKLITEFDLTQYDVVTA